MKVGIVGSRKYQSKSKVRDFIFKCKQELDEEVIIVSGGQPEGADGFAKKGALELDVEYREFPPRHYTWNSYCVNPAWGYGKPYHVRNFFDRNTEIAEYSDVVICFIPPGTEIEESKGTHDTWKKAKALGKTTTIIS